MDLEEGGEALVVDGAIGGLRLEDLLDAHQAGHVGEGDLAQARPPAIQAAPRALAWIASRTWRTSTPSMSAKIWLQTAD